jgi:chromate transporter
VRAFWFSFDFPLVASIELWAAVLSIGAMIAIFRFKAGMIQTLLACSVASVILYFAGAIR